MTDPNDSRTLIAKDASGEVIAEHVCRPAPDPGTPEWAECFRAFAAKVAEAVALFLLCLLPLSCVGPGGAFNPDAVQKEMGLLAADAAAFADLSRSLGDEQAAKVADDVALGVEKASEALAAYLEGGGTAGGVWAALEAVVATVDAYAASSGDPDAIKAAFLVGAAARRLQAWFPQAPPP